MSSSKATSAASDSASSNEADREEFAREDQKMKALALGAGAHPACVEKVLSHYAKTLDKHDDVDPNTLSDAAHAEHLRRIVASNPETHVHFQPPPPVGPHADHEGDPRVPRAPKGKTFAPGKSNSASRAEMRARKITY